MCVHMNKNINFSVLVNLRFLYSATFINFIFFTFFTNPLKNQSLNINKYILLSYIHLHLYHIGNVNYALCSREKIININKCIKNILVTIYLSIYISISLYYMYLSIPHSISIYAVVFPFYGYMYSTYIYIM